MRRDMLLSVHVRSLFALLRWPVPARFMLRCISQNVSYSNKTGLFSGVHKHSWKEHYLSARTINDTASEGIRHTCAVISANRCGVISFFSTYWRSAVFLGSARFALLEISNRKHQYLKVRVAWRGDALKGRIQLDVYTCCVLGPCTWRPCLPCID